MSKSLVSQQQSFDKTVSRQNIIWNHHTTKEKEHYRFMVNANTTIWAISVLSILFFLLEIIPITTLFSSFTKNYSLTPNSWLIKTKDLIFLTLFLGYKLWIALSIWKKRYIKSECQFINPVSELAFMIFCYVIMIYYRGHMDFIFSNSKKLITFLKDYSDDYISIEYLAFCLYFGVLLVIVRLLCSILAFFLNQIKYRLYDDFYKQVQHRSRILNIAHWESYWNSHPEALHHFNTSNFNISLPSTTRNDNFYRSVVEKYTKNNDLMQHLISLLTSDDDTIIVNETEKSIYYKIIKDLLNDWKDDYEQLNNHIDEYFLNPFIRRFHSIRNRFHKYHIETKTFYELNLEYQSSFEKNIRELNDQKNHIKKSIQQLYTESHLFSAYEQCRLDLAQITSLLSSQIIELSNYYIILDNQTTHFDTILITNRGIFPIYIQILPSNLDFTICIQKDGSWIQEKSLHEESSSDHTILTAPLKAYNHQLLLLEQLLNQSLLSKEDRYVELNPIMILPDDIHVSSNFSTQKVIHTSEFLSLLRSLPICYKEEQLLHYASLLSSCQLAEPGIKIPNYRKLILEASDQYLQDKVSLIQSNCHLMEEVPIMATALKTKLKRSILPILVK